MADKKLTALTEDTSPTTDDIVYVVNNPGGTPAEKKVTLANLLNGMLGIRSEPASGGYRIVNLYLDASKDIVAVYDTDAVP